jgi:hypothetical protein
MSRIKFPTAAMLLIMLIGAAPITASAPLSASAAAAINANTITVKSMNVKMVFDGVSLQPPTGQSVFIYNNTTYVPLRFMSYALQKSVIWDAKNAKVTVAEPSGAELVVIKEYLMNATSGSTPVSEKSVELNAVKASYVFNGSAKTIPSGQSSYLLNGSLYVPLRFLSESVGTEIKWDQKSKTINAASASYQEHNSGASIGNNGKNTSGAATPTPAPTGGASGGGSAGAGTEKASYESITSETEAKLSALQSQSQATLMSIALEYLGAKDDASKASIKARGLQQLASFTSSFNSIVSDAESKLQAGGYDTAIISQYKSEFEAQLQMGQKLAEGMAGQ